MTLTHTAHNTANTDTPFVEKDYSCRSIVPLRVLVERIIHSSRHNGVVGRDVIGNVRQPHKTI
jgi:hypothetical protein